MTTYKRFSREVLEDAVRQSSSVAGVMRLLGYKTIAGGTHASVKRMLIKSGIEIGHFLGRCTNSGKRHKGGPQKLSPQEVLVKGRRNGYKESAYKLRRALIELGREYRCEICHNNGTWMGNPMTLPIDHKDGDTSNNVPDNLRFLCPNCHSQTENFGSYKTKDRAIKQCDICGMVLNSNNVSGKCSKHWVIARSERAAPKKAKDIFETWRKRPRLHKRRFEVSEEELRYLVGTMPMVHIGKKFGVSDVAIRKRCKRLGIDLHTPYSMKSKLE